MIEDYYKTLTRRIVKQVDDGGGSYTEYTNDSDIRGLIIVLSASEQVNSQKLGLNASARLFTRETLNMTDRILEGETEYEIVAPYDFQHKYYDLKKKP